MQKKGGPPGGSKGRAHDHGGGHRAGRRGQADAQAGMGNRQQCVRGGGRSAPGSRGAAAEASTCRGWWRDARAGPPEDDGAQAAGDVPGMEWPGVQPGPTVAPAGLPEGLPETRSGMEWWVRPLWEVARGPRSKLPARPRRAFRYESICSGTLGELFGFQAIRGHRIHRSRPSRPARERAPLP